MNLTLGRKVSHFIKPNREQLRFQPLDIEKLISDDYPVRLFGKVCLVSIFYF